MNDNSTLSPLTCMGCGTTIYCGTWIDGCGPYCPMCYSIKRIRIDVYRHFPKGKPIFCDWQPFWEPKKTSDCYHTDWSLSHNTLVV